MVNVYSKPLNKTIQVNRIIGKVEGNSKGPTVVFFAGIHGNETAGVFALESVIKTLSNSSVNGTVYGISGNLRALDKHQRYIDEDLNRLWTDKNLKALKKKKTYNIEEKEQVELYSILKDVINTNTGPFYFIDLHTTSSKTPPFITINDALINRYFTKLFPVPIVLGIEEYLNGPLLSFINQLGYVSLGFESGQHDCEEAISNSIAFVYLVLVNTNVIQSEEIIGFPVHYNQLKQHSKNNVNFFEVVYLYIIKKEERFKMYSGFESFQQIKKGTVLAKSNNLDIVSKYNAKLFMPLYQKKGQDGFFIIKTITPFILRLSIVLRRLKLERLFVLFPGVFWEDNKKEVLIVNLRVAKFFAKSIFHLFGYRNKQISSNYMKLFNRERTAKAAQYKNEWWYKKSSIF